MMAEKRKRPVDSVENNGNKKKPNRGFAVGPQNLPDGAYRRKTQEIKRSLIDRAKIKKDYAKLKAQDKNPVADESIPVPASAALDDAEEPTTAPHPDRQILIEKEEDEPTGIREDQRPRSRQRRPKVAPFHKEHAEGQRRKAEAEERRKAREQAEEDRARKTAEREKFRSAMAKARTGGRNGQRKLGRESKPLLERVKRLVAESGG